MTNNMAVQMTATLQAQQLFVMLRAPEGHETLRLSVSRQGRQLRVIWNRAEGGLG